MNNNIIELKKELDFVKQQRAYSRRKALECSQKISELFEDFSKNRLPLARCFDRFLRLQKKLNRYKAEALLDRIEMQELLNALKGCL